MSKIWQPQSPDVHRHWLQSIVTEAEEKLTDWERNFVVSIEMKLDAGRVLTQLQEETLEKIYAEKTP